jgi:hypothetical protein
MSYINDAVEDDKRHNAWLYKYDKEARDIYEHAPNARGSLSYYECNLAVLLSKQYNRAADAYRAGYIRLTKLPEDRQEQIKHLILVLQDFQRDQAQQLSKSQTSSEESQVELEDSNESSSDEGEKKLKRQVSEASEESDESMSEEETYAHLRRVHARNKKLKKVKSQRGSSSEESSKSSDEESPNEDITSRLEHTEGKGQEALIYDDVMGSYVSAKQYENRVLNDFERLPETSKKIVLDRLIYLKQLKKKGLIPSNYGLEAVTSFLPESKLIPGAKLIRPSGYQVPDRVELIGAPSKYTQAWQRAVRKDTGINPKMLSTSTTIDTVEGTGKLAELIRVYNKTGKIASIKSISYGHP